MFLFGKLPSNCLIQYPSKRFGFVGSVDIRLLKLLDGKVIETDEEARTAVKLYGHDYGKRLTGRAWETRAEAVAAALALGAKVTG